MNSFDFYRFRFHFRALDRLHFPPGKSANVVRGAFGAVLRDTVPPDVYLRLFEPDTGLGPAPSGLSDWPRPFVLRVAHLDGLTIPAGETLYLDAHVFDLHRPALVHFRNALARLAETGLGPGHGRARLEFAEQLDLLDRARAVDETADAPSSVSLEPEGSPGRTVTVRFCTPTELKSAGTVADRPQFPILFGRLRDRISTLRSLYGPGPLDVDFRAVGERAAEIRMRRCELTWEQVKRRSGRTGQVHSIGGFTGEAEYEGDLAEFLPWLRAARWVGVGRQTVWGKGDVRVV
ncbi:MAG TPA: CRISPR system precrRNA processing endoribonuclease RAMP protein Cas6 [Candidatus Acidoferrales bacterium]|nr:CRISPR system precrRNA processing endoribonuclease RAMP protein Cas6 [Candidatus Acidoferrales bacterium]